MFHHSNFEILRRLESPKYELYPISASRLAGSDKSVNESEIGLDN